MDITAKINGVIQRGVKSVTVDENGHLMFTLTDGAVLDLGSVEGPKGDAGVGIASIARTSGTGAAGTTDTYTITMTNGSTATFTVYNGKDGAGKVASVNSQTGAVQIPTPASGVCGIGADIPAKVVESVSPGASPTHGALVYVKFEAANTAGNPTLTFMGYTAPIVDGGGNAVAPGALTAGTHGFQRRGETWVLLDGSGAAGEDGGYYAPSVDSGGNLTWTASKAGMPQVSGENIKGPKGVGIASIARTSGTGAAGTTDTYTITLTDGSTATFTVYNGKDGASGSGSSAVTSVNGKTGDVKLPVSGFGTCATAAATAIKVVDGLPEDFLVEDGVQLCVKFSNANTAAAPQLSVAGASAPIFDARTSNNVDAAGIGARTHHFVYFSGVWVLLDALQIIDAISIPDKLPNPNALTFTGAVTGSYDGSEAVIVEIPSGGGGSSSEPGYKDSMNLLDVTLDDETGGLMRYEYDVSGIEKTDVIIINILFPESYSGLITIKNQNNSDIAYEFPNRAKGILVGIKAMNGRYLHSAVYSSNLSARVEAPLSLFYGQLNGASGFERPKARDTITKIKFILSVAFASGTRIRIYRW